MDSCVIVSVSEAIERVGILFGILCLLVATLARCSLAIMCSCVIASASEAIKRL